jgi:hypothetical protein
MNFNKRIQVEVTNGFETIQGKNTLFDLRLLLLLTDLTDNH